MSNDLSVVPVAGDDPRDEFATPEVFDEYQPWKRPLTYATFALGLNAAGMLMFGFHPLAILLGWFALGLGIGAVVCARKEIDQFPRAADHRFVKWGKRTGWLGIVLGPISAILWAVLLTVVGLNY
jgi:hypothetical protein